ncbi:ribosome-associated protein [Deinobacterium chartae]|uniref:Ribosome-associated protein n=1 Tax=Deinobacterium chartae TaxID=521158 RepID=A0A841HTT7_9DEIO|nr:RNA-binding S4 domain-containing protein [Deinobacterium chartae]MBB6096767.1 ribosome-associated protein [Deinobacterium chartae]
MNAHEGSEAVIDLQDWLKYNDWVDSGGEAKIVVQSGQVRVNGEVETRRRRKLRNGDQVEFEGRVARVSL